MEFSNFQGRRTRRKTMKSLDPFKKWLVNNEHHTLYDFKELIASEFKIIRCNRICIHKVEDGASKKNKIASIT